MEPSKPNLAQDLIRIHKVITRGLNVSLVKGREYLQFGFSQPQELLGYSIYTHSLVSVLSAHHTGEDLIAFPEFRQYIPSAPYAKLASDHLQVERLLAPMKPMIAELSDESHKGLLAIVDRFRKIFELWEPHIQMEERFFSEAALNAVMDLKNQQRIHEAASKHSQEHSEPPYWTVPFILYNLDQDDRSRMAEGFPQVVINELVPKVWADQWAPMKPFLLE